MLEILRDVRPAGTPSQQVLRTPAGRLLVEHQWVSVGT
jgi:hypothetical protein